MLGSFCVLDKQIRQMSEDDLVLLNQLADDLIQTLTSDKAQTQKLEEIAKLQQAKGGSLQDFLS